MDSLTHSLPQDHFNELSLEFLTWLQRKGRIQTIPTDAPSATLADWPTPWAHTSWNQSYQDLLEERHNMYDRSVDRQARRINDVAVRLEEIQLLNKHSEYLFVTLNPKPETPFEDFERHVNRVATNPKIRWSIWCFELTKNGNPHAHILLQRLDPHDKNFVNRVIRQDQPSFYGNRKHIFIKGVPEHELNKVLDYLRKSRDVRSKSQANQLTLAWREEMQLSDIQTHGESPLLVSDSEEESESHSEE